MTMISWQYGVMTVYDRWKTTLPITLASLAKGGFEFPLISVDGDVPERDWVPPTMPVTIHREHLRTAGHWYCLLTELYFKNPDADRYVIFQDDLVCVRHLRDYLSGPLPDLCYFNLYTALRINEQVITHKLHGWHESGSLNNGVHHHGKPEQGGKGALALMFTNEGAVTLLTSRHMLDRARAGVENRPSHLFVDGGIVSSMNKAGWRECIHNPSLVQHIGDKCSTLGKTNHPPRALSFPGEQFDARGLCDARHPT